MFVAGAQDPVSCRTPEHPASARPQAATASCLSVGLRGLHHLIQGASIGQYGGYIIVVLDLHLHTHTHGILTLSVLMT